MKDDALVRAIESAIAKAVTEAVEDEAKKAALVVEKRVRAYAAEISATVLQRFTFERYNTELRITIDFKGIAQ